MLLIDLFETKMQRVQTMYHGTSSTLVRSILKMGLIVNPKVRTYSRDTDIEQPGYDSYGGVYITTNMQMAKDAANQAVKAHGGEPVLITLQYVIMSGFIDEDDITALFLSALDDQFDSFVMRDVAQAINNNRQAVARNLVHMILNYKDRDLSDYHPLGEINFKSDSVQQFEKLIDIVLDTLLEYEPKVKNVDARYYIEFYLLPKLRGDPAYEAVMSRLMTTLRAKNPISVRVIRNIGFRGKTRILSIVNLKTKELLYSEDYKKKPEYTNASSKLLDRNKLRKTADYYFFGNFAKGYAWGIGRTPDEAMDDAEKQFEIYDEDFGDVEWEDELRVCRVYPTNKYTYDSIDVDGSNLTFIVQNGLVVLRDET